jgi:hypothetical protein
VTRRVGLTVGAVALAWALWWLAGVVEVWTGLDDLDLLGRVLVVFAGLTGAEMVLARLPSGVSVR